MSSTNQLCGSPARYSPSREKPPLPILTPHYPHGSKPERLSIKPVTPTSLQLRRAGRRPAERLPFLIYFNCFYPFIFDLSTISTNAH